MEKNSRLFFLIFGKMAERKKGKGLPRLSYNGENFGRYRFFIG